MTQAVQPVNHIDATLLSALEAALPAGEVLTDDDSCQRYAQDVYQRGTPAGVVLRPASTAEVSAALRVLHTRDIPSVPHGGGLSYTGGLTPTGAAWAIVDLGLMSGVREVNEEDMTVTVDAGCTWAALHRALQGSGLRTPYWGTLSGIRATVGGSVSQNSIFWGSGQHGTAVDSVLSIQVVLADGTIIDTGSAAQQHSSAFFRHFGPDLTGLFCADTGAMGIKTQVTLRLMPELPAREYLAFDFPDAASTTSAMSDIARANVASECFGFDPYLQQQRLKRQAMSADVKALAGVMKQAGSVMGAIREGARVAVAGRGYMKDVLFSVQIIVEDRIAAGAAERAQVVRELCQRHGGREIENSIPKITRANPFGPPNSMLGPDGERWLPVHGLFPHSQFCAAWEATEALFATHRERSDALGIGTGYLLATVGTHCCVLEPVFFWPDEWLEIHEDAVEAAHLARLKRRDANPEARAHVQFLRSQLIALYSSMGAAHLQIGRSYRYHDALKEGPAKLVQALKRAVDPKGLMNPGALGF